MRRILAQGLASLRIGSEPDGDESDTTTANRVWWTEGPGVAATGTGTLTSIKHRHSTVSTVRFFTMDPVTRIVRDFEDVVVGLGINTYSVSISVVAGDYIGFHGASGTGYYDEYSGQTVYMKAAAAPTVGTDLTGGSSQSINDAISTLGMG